MAERQKIILKAFALSGVAMQLAACTGQPVTADSATQIPTKTPVATATIEPTHTPTAVPPEPTEQILTNKDGRQFLFSRNVDGHYDIILLNQKTNIEINLTKTDNADEMNAQVSPNGTWAVFYSDRNDHGENPEKYNRLFRIDMQSHDVTPLLSDTLIPNAHYYDPAISPDGEKVAFKLDQGSENEHGKIWVMNTDGTNLHELVLTDSEGNKIHGEMWKPAFNSNGTTLYFTVGTDNNSQIYKINPDGSGPAIKLTLDDGSSHWYPAPHPTDPNLLLITSNKSGTDQIYLMDSEGIIIQQLTDEKDDVDDSSWSSDGKQITGVENDGNQYDVITMDRNGANLKTITNTPNSELSPFLLQ